MTDAARPRLVVGLSGSSAPQYGIALVHALRDLGTVETHLVVSRGARRTIEIEAGMRPEEVEKMADFVHSPDDLAAPISSGSFQTMGMVIAPCSMKTLAAVASGYTADLVSRAADVVLKERRRLVLMLRETPLHAGHLQSMLQATHNGAIIMPPMPAFYPRPKTLDDVVNHSVGRCLDLFGIETDLVVRWGGMGKA